MRVRRRFACEVPGIELCDGGVDVVEVEGDSCDHPLVGVDLSDAEYLGVKSVGSPVSTSEADATEDEALPADRK